MPTENQTLILRAMLHAVEFTVADIVEASGVHAGTVRTHLMRYSDDVEAVGRERNGRRGGDWVKYRLRPGAAERIAAQLGHEEPPLPPSDLIAAERLLLGLSTGLDRELHDHYLGRARALREAGYEASTGVAGAHPDTPAHLIAVDLLLRLEEARDGSAWQEVAQELEERQSILAPVGGGELLAAIEQRIESSEHAQLAPAAEPAPAQAGPAGSGVAEAFMRAIRSWLESSFGASPAPGAYMALEQVAPQLQTALEGIMAVTNELDADLVLRIPARSNEQPAVDAFAAAVQHGSFADREVTIAFVAPDAIVEARETDPMRVAMRKTLANTEETFDERTVDAFTYHYLPAQVQHWKTKPTYSFYELTTFEVAAEQVLPRSWPRLGGKLGT